MRPAADGAPAAGWRAVRARYDDPREIRAYDELRDREGLNAVESRLLRAHLAPGARVLDLGAGTGREALGAAAQGLRVTAFDIVPAMVRSGRGAAAARALPVRWLVSDAAALPFGDGRFDGALLLAQFLEHFHGRAVRRAVLREAARVVRPGGVLLLSVHHGLRAPGVAHWLHGYAARRAAGELPHAGGRGLRRLVRRQTWLRAADLRDAARLARTRARFEAECAWRRAGRALGAALPEPGDGWTDTVSHAGPAARRMPFHPYRPGELERDLAAAGLALLETAPWPDAPGAAAAGLARRGAAFRYAAARVGG